MRLILVLVALTSFAMASVCARPAPGALVSWWRAEGNTTDSVGSNNGTAGGGTGFAAAGAVGQAFQFDGVDDFVDVADNPSLAITKSLTIEAWIKPFANPGSSGGGMILFRGDDRPGLDPYFVRFNTDGRVEFAIQNAADQFSSVISQVVPLNVFTHIRATLDDTTGQQSLYVNEVLAAFAVTSLRPFATLDAGSNPGLGIGNHHRSPSFVHNFPFNGLIDEVKIYDSVVPEPVSAAILVAAAAMVVSGRSRRIYCVRSFGMPLTAVAVLMACVLAQPTMAQSSNQAPATRVANDEMTAIEIPAQPDAIRLGTGPLPGATAPESWHSQYGSKFARNVTVATLTPFLPDPSKASGAAVIVAPGGGFRALSMENEGSNVARALAERGVAAFVLKYRLNQTPADLDTFARSPMGPGSRPATRPSPGEMAAQIAPQITDANAAFALVRSNAAKWHVDPDRIGMIGFSAGAMLTMATTLNNGEAKPAFIGNIYGPLGAADVPPDAPPLFAAVAADDPLFGLNNFGLIEAWRKAKRPVEFHYYEQGGHGFGMYPKETTSTGWFDAYVKWLGMHGYLRPKS